MCGNAFNIVPIALKAAASSSPTSLDAACCLRSVHHFDFCLAVALPPFPRRFAADATARAKIIKSELKIKKSPDKVAPHLRVVAVVGVVIVVVGRGNRFALPLPLFPSFDLLLCCLSVCCLVMMFVCLLCGLSPDSILYCIAHTLTRSNSAFSGLQVSHVSAKWRPQNRHGVMQRVCVCTYISMYVRVLLCDWQKPAGALHARGETCTARKKRAPKALYAAMETDKSFRLHCALSERDRDEEKETAYKCKTQRESGQTNVQGEKERRRERRRE